MSAAISCIFFIALAVNTYYAAKREGRWSWPQFCIVLVSLVAIPILILVPLMHLPWLQDKPAWFTLIYVSLIMLSVCALAYVLNKFRPQPKRPPHADA